MGQHALGGTVFYVDSTGAHGLVATNSQNVHDQTWNGNISINITVNATGNGIGAGVINTSLMVGVQSSYAASQTSALPLVDMAAQVCVNYAIQDDGNSACGNPGTAGETCYANWYLPSKYELYQMYLQRSVLGPHVDDWIWSSTEVDSASAWRINFNGGAEDATDKTSSCGVWCIHSF